jgi:hypothetical protein
MKPSLSFYHIRNPQIDDDIFLEPCCALIENVLDTYQFFIQTSHITVTHESNPHRVVDGMKV